MRIQEDRHPNEPWLLWKIGNWTAVDSDWIRSYGVAWLFKEDGLWRFVPRITTEQSLFFNSIFFVRYTMTPLFLLQLAAAIYLSAWWPILCFGLFFAFRWSSSTTERALFQTGFGQKLNGRLGLPFRFQSDASSAAGVTGANIGQATGFNYGPH